MKPTIPVAALAGLAVLLASCSPKKEPKPTVGANATSAAATASEGTAPAAPTRSPAAPTAKVASTLPVISAAPAWKLTGLDGKELSSDAFKGKVVVLDFWATWCPPCRAEIPGYVDLYRKYGADKLAIVGVSVDEGGAKVVQDFVKKFGINYPVVMADQGVVAAYGGIEAIPTTFLIDRDGQIRDKKVGAESTEAYEKKIASLLE